MCVCVCIYVFVCTYMRAEIPTWRRMIYNNRVSYIGIEIYLRVVRPRCGIVDYAVGVVKGFKRSGKTELRTRVVRERENVCVRVVLVSRNDEENMWPENSGEVYKTLS